MDSEKFNCDACEDEHYILTGCCSGRECGCRGQPVRMYNCPDCNLREDKDMGSYVAKYAPFIEYVRSKPTTNKE